MSETIIVRVLTEDDWYAYRALRLAGLQESPEAFLGCYTEEVAYSEERWRSRMRRGSRLLAERDGAPRESPPRLSITTPLALKFSAFG